VIDHLVLAAPDPLATRGLIAERTGVTLSAGGAHVGRGTRNWLGSLGPTTYLELIGPDPDQPAPAQPRPFGVDSITEATVTTWCARYDDLAALIARAAAAGLQFSEPFVMEREAPAGRLRWRLSLPEFDTAGGIVPFFIDWGDSPHPAATAVTGLSVVEFAAEHPDPGSIGGVLDALGVDLPVHAGGHAHLIVTLRGPAGELRFG
jgi:hypothetical protein